MSHDFSFSVPDNIGSADELLLTLDSIVENSSQIWSGITNEAPYQRLVEKLKELKQINDEYRSKRAKLNCSSFEILAGSSAVKDRSDDDDDWFNAIYSIMETSDFMHRFVNDTILRRRSAAKKRRKPYESHN